MTACKLYTYTHFTSEEEQQRYTQTVLFLLTNKTSKTKCLPHTHTPELRDLRHTLFFYIKISYHRNDRVFCTHLLKKKKNCTFYYLCITFIEHAKKIPILP